MVRTRELRTGLALAMAAGLAVLGWGIPETCSAGPLLPLGDAADYVVLYEGTGGHTLQIANVTIGGNVGVGGTGQVHNNGPSDITGRVDFSATNTGQYSTAPGNTGPTSVNFNVAEVTSALSTVNSLNASLTGGNGLAINISSGNQIVNESDGLLETVNSVTYRVFNVTSYQATDGNFLTINGDGSSDPVVFNFAQSLGNVNLKGLVTLGGGLTDDSVLWNFEGSGQNINLNTNNSSFPTDAFHGVILAPDDVLSMNAANLDGRLFGGDSGDMQFVSHNVLDGPTDIIVPEPSTLISAGIAAVIGLSYGWRRRTSRLAA